MIGVSEWRRRNGDRHARIGAGDMDGVWRHHAGLEISSRERTDELRRIEGTDATASELILSGDAKNLFDIKLEPADVFGARLAPILLKSVSAVLVEGDHLAEIVPVVAGKRDLSDELLDEFMHVHLDLLLGRRSSFGALNLNDGDVDGDRRRVGGCRRSGGGVEDDGGVWNVIRG